MPMRAFPATVPGFRRLGARRSIFLGASGCVCVWVLPGYLEPFWHHFWSFCVSVRLHVGPFWGQNPEILGSWGVRGGAWEPCWTPWPARQTQVAENAEKGSPLGPPFGDTVRHLFLFLSVFVGDLVTGWFLEGFWARFWKVVG